MGEMDELYQEVILDHYKKPRNFGVLDTPDRKLEGYNPLCGDRFLLTVKMNGDVIEDIRFQGGGCAISTASASIMTAAVKGKTKAEVAAMFEKFHRLVTGEPAGAAADLGKLAVFAGVSAFPMRVKCATLAWHTLKAVLEGNQETVSTE